MHQMLRNNLVHIFRRHMAIPDSFGVHDNGRPMLALVEAAGLIRPNCAFYSRVFNLVFEDSVQPANSIAGAGRPRAARFPNIGADKNVMLKFRQNSFTSFSIL